MKKYFREDDGTLTGVDDFPDTGGVLVPPVKP